MRPLGARRRSWREPRTPMPKPPGRWKSSAGSRLLRPALSRPSLGRTSSAGLRARFSAGEDPLPVRRRRGVGRSAPLRLSLAIVFRGFSFPLPEDAFRLAKMFPPRGWTGQGPFLDSRHAILPRGVSLDIISFGLFHGVQGRADKCDKSRPPPANPRRRYFPNRADVSASAVVEDSVVSGQERRVPGTAILPVSMSESTPRAQRSPSSRPAASAAPSVSASVHMATPVSPSKRSPRAPSRLSPGSRKDSLRFPPSQRPPRPSPISPSAIIASMSKCTASRRRSPITG